MSRRQRRRLVAAMYAAFAAFIVVMYAGYTSVPRWPWWLAVFAVVTFVATGAVFVRLAAAPGCAVDTVDRLLDERQRMVRDRSYRVAYYASTSLFLGLSVVVMYAAGSDGSWSAFRQPALFLPWAAFLVGSLPTAIVAYAEPDPPEDA